MHAHIRSVLVDLVGSALAHQIPILYGISQADNARELLEQSISTARLLGCGAGGIDFAAIIEAAVAVGTPRQSRVSSMLMHVDRSSGSDHPRRMG